jgi:hypothetical protein
VAKADIADAAAFPKKDRFWECWNLSTVSYYVALDTSLREENDRGT